MAELDVSPVQFRVRANAAQRVGVNPSTGARVILVPVPGGQGRPGAAGTNAYITGVTVAGDQDGVNSVFTTPDVFGVGSVSVYRNGLREFPGVGFEETGDNEITFSTAPLTDDEITVDYVIA